MQKIQVMLKKFSEFWHEEPAKNMEFEPYVTTINGHLLQLMKASDEIIVDLLQLEQKVYAGRTPWDKFSFKTELAKWRNSLYLVAYESSQLVGFIGMRLNEKDMHITNIAVDPQYQRQGIGKLLLQIAIDKGYQNDARTVSLEVNINNKKARNLYHNFGFDVTQVHEKYYQDDGTNADALEMHLYLKPQTIKRKEGLMWQ